MFLNKKNLKKFLAPQAIIFTVAIGFYCLLEFKSEAPIETLPSEIVKSDKVESSDASAKPESLDSTLSDLAVLETKPAPKVISNFNKKSKFKASNQKNSQSASRRVKREDSVLSDLTKISEENFDELEQNELVAINPIEDPILLELADKNLSEEFPSLAQNFVQFEEEVADILYPSIKPVLSYVKQNDFSNIDASYRELAEESKSLVLAALPKSKDVSFVKEPVLNAEVSPQLASAEMPSHMITKIAESIEQRLHKNEELSVENNTVTLDPTVESWLENKQGHVEIHAENTQNKNDFHILEYSKKDSHFELPKNTQSSYNLIARFFVPNKTTPIAEIKHTEPVTPYYDEKPVVFNVSSSDFHQALKQKSKEIAAVPLVITVFKGLVGNRDAPETIADAEVSIVGMPKKFRTKDNGILRLSNVPSQSEYILVVKKPGFYPTRKVIATAEETTYQSIYLLPKNTVDIVTKDFLKDPQIENRSIVFGRVFNPFSRLPLKGEKVLLPFENSKTVYFDAFPTTDSFSTQEGLFSIFNVTPDSHKTVTRSRAIPSQVFDLKQNEAQYIELGSHRPQRLFGKILNGNGVPIAKARVKLVGENQTVVYSDEKGNFYIDEIDYPKGILSLEIEAKDFYSSIHTIGWHPDSKQIRHKFYLREVDKVESAVHLAQLGKSVLKKAAIIGGVDRIPQEMAAKNQCLFIELMDSSGNKITKEHGPFLLQDNPHLDDEPCIHTKNSGFGFYNLEDGLYHLKINQKNHVVLVSSQKASMIVSPY